jgi:hypothetical protein
MLRILIVITTLALSPGAALAETPTDAVAFFYHLSNSVFDPAFRDRFADAAADRLDENEALAADGDAGCIDWSLALDAQDYDEAEFMRTIGLEEEMIDGTAAVVTATFRLFPADENMREIIWTVVNRGGEWKITDIASPASDWRLSELDCK